MNALHERLLVVDDDENNRDMLSRRLVRQGYTVDVAESGSDALEKINHAHYDLVLLDQMMPGMSGLDLLRLLRAVHSPSDLPVIMVSAMDQSETIVDALNGGANDYVTKPVNMPVVAARIEAQLARSRSDRAIRESEERHALAARNSGAGYWDVNLVTGEVFVAEAWIAVLGYTAKEIEQNLAFWLSLVHPEDEPRVRELMKRLLASGEPREVNIEFRFREKGGTHRWTLARGSTVRGDDGNALRLVGSFTDLTPIKFTDGLTGLGNRLMLLDRLGEAVAIHKGAARAFALMLLDLDGFKLINDTLGDHAGDRILAEVGQRIRKTIAEAGFPEAPISRIGGDEFTVVLTNVQSRVQVTKISRNVLDRLSMPINFDGHDVAMTGSMGIVIDEPGIHRAEDLLRNAELAMYRAKERGKDCAQVFEPAMRARAATRTALVHDLRFATSGHQLVAMYQAKVDIKTRAVVGFEALIRWQHPERGLLSPLEFIPLAEEHGFICEIGEWILREAAGQMAAWQTAHPELTASMNVNLSVKQLADRNLPARVQAILNETGIARKTLKLELTESALMIDVDSSRGVLAELQGMGIGLKLDDFGTGYSSLSYLRALHFDSLKIDKSFIDKIVTDPETHAIVETIINLAHTLGMSVVAEGIEQEQQLIELEKMGCDVGQGYYFSRPLDAAAAEALWLASPALALA